MSTTFCELARSRFDGQTRARGDAYQREGRVEIRGVEAGSVFARVRGTSVYSVDVDVLMAGAEPPEVITDCSCPYAQDGWMCKHIWAVLRQIDLSGILVPPPRAVMVDLADMVEVDDLPFDGPLSSEIPSRRGGSAASPRLSGWRRALSEIERRTSVGVPPRPTVIPAASGQTETRYMLHFHPESYGATFAIHPEFRSMKQSGGWGKWKRITALDKAASLPDESFRLVAATLAAASIYGYGYGYGASAPQVALVRLLPQICATGSLYGSADEEVFGPLAWDDGPPWQFELELAASPSGSEMDLQGRLVRGEERRGMDEPMRLSDSWIIWPDRISRFVPGGSLAWVSAVRESRLSGVPSEEAAAFVAELVKTPGLPAVRLPPELRFEEIRVKPEPHLAIRAATPFDPRSLPATLEFAYAGHRVPAGATSATLVLKGERRMLVRDMPAEAACAALLQELGGRRSPYQNDDSLLHIIPVGRLVPLVSRVTAEGWTVTARGKLYRLPGRFDVSVQSGIDWFDLSVTCEYGDQQAALPALLEAVRRKQGWVELGDGSLGLVPDDWLRRYGNVAALGQASGETIRFRSAQAGLLDAWLSVQPDARLDEVFARVRDELQRFTAIEPVPEPAGFVGQLRPYQREGLGWLTFLQQFGFGGCLADDMGLGKTIQVLALLEMRRSRRAADGLPPSLVVAPRSLISNWIREAQRFTPALRMLDHTGLDRALPDGWADAWDVVVTTYGTLRRDIGLLKDVAFDYVVLDESQAVKNSVAQTAKAVRLLKGRHRLALSGTPVENHLGELWSLFEFLNPGLLGGASGFGVAWARNPDPEQRALLARALRPFILRRNKKQVAPDLPERQEDTLYCELTAHQRKQYDQLKEHYRQSLLAKVARSGLSKSKIQVLEALLRLRQCACHPALIDGGDGTAPCAKFETLLPQLEEVVEEGHKALVFSQFTSFLALLRGHLDRKGVTYEYLDGQTRDRQARVDRFQQNPEVPLFLISLKAGGLGLNLTAAEYVFLLDPWWNPAVEAQAIDRSHRIGQRNKVLAYRLIARNTVEEKVLALQERKRDLANAIIGADNALVRDLTREDLEFLLG